MKKSLIRLALTQFSMYYGYSKHPGLCTRSANIPKLLFFGLAAQDNYIKSKKEESLAEAAEGVRHEQKALRSASLEYVYLMHVVQERKKFDFVETLWSFMHSWSNYYRFGHERTQVSAPYMNDLKVYMYEYCYIDNIVAKNVYFRETVFSLSQRLRSMFFVLYWNGLYYYNPTQICILLLSIFRALWF